jgi:hypothetical protein
MFVGGGGLNSFNTNLFQIMTSEKGLYNFHNMNTYNYS